MKERSQFYLGLLAYISTTALFYFGLLSNALWFFIWLYPIPLLLYSYNNSRQNTILVSFAAFVTASITVIVPEYTKSLLPTPLEIVPSILHSLIFTAFITLNRYSIRRLPYWLSPFTLPVCFSAYQYIWSFSTLSNFIHFGVSTQANFLPLLQVTSITGPIGIAFMTHFFATSVSCIIYFRRKPIKWLINLLVLSIVLGSTLGYGFYRLAHPQPTQRVTVALGSINPPHLNAFAFADPTIMQQRILNYPQFIDRLAVAKPQFVMTPEIWLQLNDSNRQMALQLIEGAARKNHTTVIAAIKLYSKINTNSAWIIDPSGKLVGQYNKIHLIPYIEDDLTPGCCPHVFVLNGVRIGVSIGDDTLFRQPSLGYGRLNTQLMFVPSADNGLTGTADERRRVAIVHLVSNGISMARAAEFGELTLTDAYGRIFGNMAVDLGEQATLVGQVPIGIGATFYTRHPNWFGLTCLTGVALIVLLLLSQLPAFRRWRRLRKD